MNEPTNQNWYSITVKLRNREKPYHGVRQYVCGTATELEIAIRKKLLKTYKESDIIGIEIFQLSKDSDLIKDHLLRKYPNYYAVRKKH
jgi:hypothetical protein